MLKFILNNLDKLPEDQQEQFVQMIERQAQAHREKRPTRPGVWLDLVIGGLIGGLTLGLLLIPVRAIHPPAILGFLGGMAWGVLFTRLVIIPRLFRK
jgi:predicted lipid-binding transport protein (Tim44 family)